MDKDTDIYPEGVELRDFEDSDTLRNNIFEGTKAELAKSFPQEYGGVTLELSGLKYADDKRVTLAEQKKAILQNKYVHRRLRGTLTLKDSMTGDVLDTLKNHTIMRVPYLTDRSTFIHNGSEYSVLNQSRLESGIYSRRKSNGDLESHINPERGKGKAMRVRFEPETSLFKLDIGQASLNMYSVLKDIGVLDGEIEQSWGPDLLERNRNKYDARTLNKAYTLFAGYEASAEATPEERIQVIKDAIHNTQIKQETLNHTLHRRYEDDE